MVAFRTVLLVQGRAPLLATLSEAFESEGALVLPAVSVDEALALLGTLTPDVVVTELYLGQQTAFDLLPAIERSLVDPRTPVFLMTGDLVPSERLLRERARFAGVFVKPVHAHELVRCVLSHLR